MGFRLGSRRLLLAGNLTTILVTLTLATGAYGVLTGATERTRLDVRGTVDASAVSAGYDILVRLDETYRRTIEDIRRSELKLRSGEVVRLDTIADVVDTARADSPDIDS